MYELIQIFAILARELFAAGKDDAAREAAYKRAEERLAVQRKHAKYGKPGGG